jgi:hypothetical protein
MSSEMTKSNENDFARQPFHKSRIGSSGRIRTYDQSVNSRPLYH